MVWTECQYRKGEIDNAGQLLITLAHGEPDRDEALEIINNWRSCHSYPLHIVTKTLKTRAKTQVSKNSLVARRIKRMSSIALKLRHNSAMKLSQMHEIGGCRAVLEKVSEVEDLVKYYYEAFKLHPDLTDRAYPNKKYDYITNPKQDGYRGVHIIMKYQSTAKPSFNGQRIEIQIRSRLQHAWATAVETCQAFTGQALKSKIKEASDSWLRFFSLMSAAIAEREKRPIVPGTPQTRIARKKELKDIEKQEQIITQLTGWSAAMQHPTIADDPKAVAYLLELNITNKTLMMDSFREIEMPSAHAQYLAREKATENDLNVQVVLVSADSVTNLKRAYPNFYVDTKAFAAAIQQEIY